MNTTHKMSHNSSLPSKDWNKHLKMDPHVIQYQSVCHEDGLQILEGLDCTYSSRDLDDTRNEECQPKLVFAFFENIQKVFHEIIKRLNFEEKGIIVDEPFSSVDELVNSGRCRMTEGNLYSESRCPEGIESFDYIDDSDDDEKSTCPPFIVRPEEPMILRDSPHILPADLMRMLHRALPPSVQHSSCHRAYSVSRDGDAFSTMQRLVCGYKHTLLVVESVQGEIFGGYADHSWSTRAKPGQYYGHGTGFLFSVNYDEHSGSQVVRIYRWTGANSYVQYFDPKKGILAMGGGGGSFGLLVCEWFRKGSSAPCDTFGNPCLLNENEHFEVKNFEIFGFGAISFG